MCGLQKRVYSAVVRDMSETRLENRVTLRVVLLLLLSVTMVSSASILVKLSQSHALVIVFWRTLLGSGIMVSAGLVRHHHKQARNTVNHGNLRWLLLVGLILALHFYTWFTSLSLTTVAASVVLVNTSPIFTAFLSTLVLREPLRWQAWLGVIIAVSGALIMTGNDLITYGTGALIGDVLAIISGILLALYFIGGRRFAAGRPITVYTAIVYFSAAVSTVVLCVITGVNPIVVDPHEMLIFLALAVFPTALGHSVNNYLLTLVPAYVVSSAVLGEPIGATILAVIVYGATQIPTVMGLFGFGVILLGIIIVLVATNRQDRSSTASTLDYTNGP